MSGIEIVAAVVCGYLVVNLGLTFIVIRLCITAKEEVKPRGAKDEGIE